MRTLLFCFSFFLGSVVFNSIHGADLHLGVEDSWPPFAEKDGEGLSTTIVKHAFAAVGVDVEISVLPYARVLQQLEKGNLDGGYNVTKQDSTEAIFNFGKQPILKASASFYYKAGENFPYKSIKQLPKDIRIGLIRGYEYGNLYENNKEKFIENRLNTQKQIINMIIRGRVDAAIMFDKVAEFYIEEMGVNDQISKGFFNHTSDIYVAFSKNKKESHVYSNKLDEGIKLLIKNGAYDKIMRGEIKDTLK